MHYAACRVTEKMKAIRARLPLDTCPLQRRIKHEPSQVVLIVRPAIRSREDERIKKMMRILILSVNVHISTADDVSRPQWDQFNRDGKRMNPICRRRFRSTELGG